MSQYPNKIGMSTNINTTRFDEISEAITNSLKEQFSNISTESSKIVLERLQPLLQANQTDLNSLSEQLGKLKKNYKLSGKEMNPTMFKKKSLEVSEKVKKIKNKLNENNEFVQMSDHNANLMRRTLEFSDNFKSCMNNLDSTFETNAGKYRISDIYEFSDKLGECTNFFMAKANSLEMSIGSYLNNGLSQREVLKEKLRKTLNKLEEINHFVNQNKNSKSPNYIMENNQFNFNPIPHATANKNNNLEIDIRNSTRDDTANFQFENFSPEDFSFFI